MSKQIWLEQKLPMGGLLGEGAGGTADLMVYDADTGALTIADYKFGRNKVEPNSPQLLIYGVAGKDFVEALGYQVETVDCVVIQPAINHFETYRIPDVETLAAVIMADAEAARDPGAVRIPGPEQCRWCLGKATCPELRAEVSNTVGDLNADPFEANSPDASEDDAHLPGDLARIPMIQDWCKARLAHAEKTILSGTEVPGWKVVPGRLGARKWIDEEQTIAAFKSMRIPQHSYLPRKLVTPTQGVKLAGKRQLAKLEELITRAPGRPAVVPETDKREAMPVAHFDNLDQEDSNHE